MNLNSQLNFKERKKYENRTGRNSNRNNEKESEQISRENNNETKEQKSTADQKWKSDICKRRYSI